MSSVRLNPLDAAWVFTEARATPNHVGGLLEFRLPEGASRDFMRELMAEFRSHREFKAPWNRRMKFPVNVNPMPVWIEDDDIDLEYHVRHSALPWPGGERELGELVGRLQSTPIDLSRPPWECTIIEGLEGNRFALFIKMHHSLIDGVSGMKLLQRAMSPDREKSLRMPPFWSAGSERSARPDAGAPAPTYMNAAAAVVRMLRGQVQTVPQLIAAFAKILKRIGDPGEGMVVPFVDSPRSVLNGRIREKRRFATQQFSLERMRAVAKAADATLNDIVLAICGGALRRFLHERKSLPEKSLTAGIPVSMRARTLLWISIALAVFGMVVPSDHLADAAHLGGIAAGCFYVRRIVQGGGWRFAWPSTRTPRRRPLELVKTAAARQPAWKRAANAPAEDLPPEEFISREVDPILEKISAHGIQSLTDRERRILEAARARMAKH